MMQCAVRTSVNSVKCVIDNKQTNKLTDHAHCNVADDWRGERVQTRSRQEANANQQRAQVVLKQSAAGSSRTETINSGLK